MITKRTILLIKVEYRQIICKLKSNKNYDVKIITVTPLVVQYPKVIIHKTVNPFTNSTHKDHRDNIKINLHHAGRPPLQHSKRPDIPVGRPGWRRKQTLAPVTNRIRLPVGPEDGGYFQIEAQHIGTGDGGRTTVVADGWRTLVDSLLDGTVVVVVDVSVADCLFLFFS